jgi:hypothetical protein
MCIPWRSLQGNFSPALHSLKAGAYPIATALWMTWLLQAMNSSLGLGIGGVKKNRFATSLLLPWSLSALRTVFVWVCGASLCLWCCAGVKAAPTTVTLSQPVTSQGYYGVEVSLSWSQNQDGDFAEYRLYRATHSNVTQSDTLVTSSSYASQTQATDYGATPSPTPGTTYYYRVFVRNQNDESTPSNEVSVAVVDAAPQAVNLAAPQGGYYGEVNLSWTRSYEPDIAFYKVYRATHATVTQNDTLVATLESQYANGDPVQSYDSNAPAAPAPGITYYYRVFVVDNAGQATGSNERTCTQVDAAPQAVQLLAPQNGYYGSEVSLSWVRPSEYDIASYKVFRATHSGVTTADTLVYQVAPNEIYNDPVQGYDWNAPASPAPGTRYYYRVFVYDNAGQATGSNEESLLCVDAVPQAVTLAVPSAGYSSNEVRLSWTRNYENDVVNYRVYRATHAGVTETDSLVSTINASEVSGDPVEWSDSLGTALGTFYYRVFVTDAAGQSTGSNEQSYLRLPDVLNPPDGVRALPGDQQVTVSWRTRAFATFYSVYRAEVAGGPYTQIATNVTGLSYVDTGLTNGTTYHFVVRAHNAQQNSDDSDEVAAIPVEANGGSAVITVTEPEDNTYITQLDAVSGTVDEGGQGFSLHHVDLRIYRLWNGSREYWNGAAWVTASTPLTVTLTANGTNQWLWSCASPLPSGAALPDGDYHIRAVAYHDGPPQSVAVYTLFRVGTDRTRPVVSVTTPQPQGQMAQLTSISGECYDPPGPSGENRTGMNRILVYLKRQPGATAEYWNFATHQWGTARTFKEVAVATPDTTYWAVDSDLPTVADLPSGAYSIMAFGYDRMSLKSNVVTVPFTVTVPDAPEAVTLNQPLQATGSYGAAVSLSWSQSASPNFSTYKLYRATHAGVTKDDTLVVTLTNAGDTQTWDDNVNAIPAPGTTYYYRVFVTDYLGQSTGSNERSLAVVDAPPAPVTLVSVESGSYANEVRLSWTRSSESDLATYKIYRATHAAVTESDTLAATLNANEVSGDPVEGYDYNAPASPAPGTTYYYRIFVVDSAGQSSGSNEKSLLRLDAPPQAVTLSSPIGANNGAGPGVQLTWTRSGEADVASYKLFRATHAGVTTGDTLVATVTGSEASDPVTAWDGGAVGDPAPGTTYYYRVFVEDNAGQRTGSNEESVTLVDSAPAAVTLLDVVPAYGSEVRLSWTRNYENDVVTYKVYRATHANVTEADTLVATLEASNAYGDPIEASDYNAPATAPPGTRYYYRIFVYDAAGQSAGSNEKDLLRIDPAPASVVLNDPTITSGYYGPAVQLSWSASSESDFASYALYRATHVGVTQNDTLVTTITSSGETQTTDYNVSATPAPGTTYYYRVFVTDQGGQSAGSNEESITLTDAVPSAVTLLAPSSDYYPGTVRLRWTRSYESDIATYKVYRATHAAVTESDTLVATVESQNAYGDPIETYDYNAPASLPPGTRYYYRVFVYDAAGQSAGSNEESILLVLPPQAPGTPAFSAVTMTTLKAEMPPLPPGAASLTLQKRLASQYEWEFADVATGLAGGVVVDVTGLTGSTDYSFRAVAVGPGGSTPGAEAGVRTAELPPGAPSAPNFSDITHESVKVHAPALPERTEWLRLQMKAAGTPDSTYVDVATQVQSQDVTSIGDLTSGDSYTFRYVAVGPGGATPGAAASVTLPVPFHSWSAYSGISCGGIRWPVASANTIAPGAEGSLSSFLATDWDKRETRISVGGQQSLLEARVLSDTCTYTWGATGGTFPGGTQGQSVKWLAPTTPGTYTLTLVVDDQGGANKPDDEVGTRDDAMRGYNDEPLRFSITVIVQAPAP